MLGNLFSQLRGKPAQAPEPASVPAPIASPAGAITAAVRKWIADDTLPAFDARELAADPRRLAAANALAGNGDLAGARGQLQDLLAQQPGSIVDHMLLVDCLLRAGEITQAQGIARDVMTQGGRMGARAAAQLAERALFLGNINEARELAERALAVTPECVAAHVVMGCALDALGPTDATQYVKALDHHRRALMLRVDAAMPRFHLACSLLRQNRLREGFTEWVAVEMQGGIYSNRDACPVWSGQPLGTQTLLMLAHSGFGDMALFLRFARQLREREPRARLVLLIHRAMARLAEATGWFDAVYADNVGSEAFDWQTTMTHLPLLFDTRPEDLPGTGTCLQVPAEHVHAAAAWLPPPSGRKRVGLRWAGNAGLLDAKRNIPLEACKPLFAVPGIEWVALAEDAAAAAQARQYGLLDTASRINDFQDTAALICNLDLVFSVDTSVANLACALGKPTWVLSRPDPDWRWGASGAQSPWFDTARVFRHPKGDLDWSAVIAEASAALVAWARS